MSGIDETQAEGQYETRKESDQSQRDMVARWLSEIDLASNGEKNWRKQAEKARDVYRSEKDGDGQRFNILFSNIQTAVPALYNSTPSPDVRTRYNDEDEVARMSGQSIERVLSYSMDAYPFDGVIKAAVQDRELAGRGAARVRYVPYEYQGKVYQEVTCEHVPWKHYLLGPSIRFEDLPWITFEHFLTRDQLTELAPEKGGGIKLDFTLSVADKGKAKADTAPNVFKRARIYEIWSKKDRKVYWIAPSYADGPIRVDDDPLGLVGFFPFPEPLYAIRTSDTLVPVCPYQIVMPLVEELEEITVRIQALVRVCKWRGIRHPSIPSFERLEEAVDGELIAPLDGGDLLGLIQGGGIAQFVWLMPIKEVTDVLQALYLQREQIKQTIFEVSGLADIMRGQSDPNETLGAQEIKANFGTMRLQDAQKDVQRFCRDLLRLKAEIACNLFDSQNLAMMTGMNLPSRQEVEGAKQQLQMMQQQAQQPPMPPGGPQMGHNGGPAMMGGQPPQGAPVAPGPPQAPPAPPPELVELAGKVSWEDVLETLKSGIMRSYKIDIETDSTILGDVRQAQQQASAFLEGTAKFMQAVAPAVQTGIMKMDVAVDLFASIARRFKLGKQAEDALSRMSHEAQKNAKNPPPPQPSPEEIKLKGEMEKMQVDMQMSREKHGMEMQAMQAMQANMAATQQTKQMEIQGKQKAQEIDLQGKVMDAEIKQRTAYQDMELKAQQSRQDMATAMDTAAVDEYNARVKQEHDERGMKMKEMMAVQKHKRDMAKPAAGRPN